MMSSRPTTRYSRTQMALHWGIAGLVLFQIVYGEAMTRFVDAGSEGTAPAPLDVTIASAHFWSGLAILALVVARLVVRFTRGVPPHPAATHSLAALAKLAAGAMHWLFYLLLLAVPVTGLLTYYGLADLGDVHALAKPIFVGLVAVHAGAALFHQLVLRDGTLGRMLPVPLKA